MLTIFKTLVLHPIDLPDAGRVVRIWTDEVFRSVVAVFGFVALAACLIPARRASRIDALLPIADE